MFGYFTVFRSVIFELVNSRTPVTRRKSTILPEEPKTLLLQEEEAASKAEAEHLMPVLTMFTDGLRLDSGAAGYSVVWQNSQHWGGSQESRLTWVIIRKPTARSALLLLGHWKLTQGGRRPREHVFKKCPHSGHRSVERVRFHWTLQLSEERKFSNSLLVLLTISHSCKTSTGSASQEDSRLT